MGKRVLLCLAAAFLVWPIGVSWSGDGPPAREEVVAFVERAVDFARTHGREKALRAFMDRQGAFVSGELYIFAYNFDGTVLSHGGQAHLVGKNLMDMRDANGIPVIAELAKLARDGGGWLYYLWPNPLVQNAVVPKLGYVEKVDDTWFLGSGTYGQAAVQKISKDELLGENLLRQVWTNLRMGRVDEVTARLAPAFQSVHPGGVRDRVAEIAYLKGLKVPTYRLDRIWATRSGSTLLVSYTVAVPGPRGDRRKGVPPSHRLSVFQETEKGWQWIAHANLKPLP
jgi:hypothetical protein